MKFITMFGAVIALAFAAQAQAADTLFVKVTRGGNSVVVPLTDARWINLSSGSQSYTDENGNSYSITIAGPDVTALTGSANFQARWTNISGNIYLNVSRAVSVQCNNGQTNIGWAVGSGEFDADNCLAFNALVAQAK